MLRGLVFPHEAGVVHTGECFTSRLLNEKAVRHLLSSQVWEDLHSDNLVISLANDAILATVEENEITAPSARKQFGDLVTLEGEDKENFIFFVSCFLNWLPEERLPPLQAYFLPWLRGESIENFAARVGFSYR